ncbi:transcriptional antiterminator [Rhodobacterales bacterium 59_46_T64]|nr:transcriptional antiterminator [Rhodobacterales bacterium 59_46_T64]
MTQPPALPRAMSRRTALTTLAASALVPVASRLAAAAGDASLHHDIARRARALTAGQKINLQLLLPEGSRANVTPVIAQFLAMTGVHVTFTESSLEEINTQLTLDALSNTHTYDLALPATFGVPDLVASKAILPLSKFVAKHEPEGFRDDILYQVGDSFDGETYGFQTDGDAYVMFYNKAMLKNPTERARYADQYGVELEKPLTWQELDRQMAFFNRPEQGQWGGLLFRSLGHVAWEWWVRFHAKGVWPFSPDMEPQITSSEGISALEDMIRSSESLCPEAAHVGVFQNWERYSRGDVYCNIGWGGSQKYFNSAGSGMRGNMVYGPTPGGMLEGELLITPYFNWGWNYVVASNSAFPELAYLFALFASTPEMSTLAVRQKDGFFDPFRPEHYDDIGIKSAYSEEFLAVHRASLEASIPDLYLKNQGAYFRILSEWISRALSGEVSPQEAMERVAQTWQVITSGAGRPLQIKRWEQLRAKYPARIRRVLRDLS